MARWLALMAFVAVGSGCALKVPTGAVPQYDYTEYETYDQPLNADVNLGFANMRLAATVSDGERAPELKTARRAVSIGGVAPGTVMGLR